MWPRDLARRLALLAFALPILLPVPAAVVASASMTPLWMMSAMTLAPVVLLSSPLLVVPRPTVVRIVALAIIFPLLMAAASPVIAIIIHRTGVPNDAGHYRLLAAAIDQAWRETSDRPLPLVGSNSKLVNGVVFYLSSRPSSYELTHPQLTPWVDKARIAREGIAVVCPADDDFCNVMLDRLASRLAPGKNKEVTLSRTYFGTADSRKALFHCYHPTAGPTQAVTESVAVASRNSASVTFGRKRDQ